MIDRTHVGVPQRTATTLQGIVFGIILQNVNTGLPVAYPNETGLVYWVTLDEGSDYYGPSNKRSAAIYGLDMTGHGRPL